MKKDLHTEQSFLPKQRLALTTMFLVLLGGAYVVSNITYRYESNLRQRNFLKNAINVYNALQNEINGHVSSIHSIKALISTMGEISNEKFMDFTSYIFSNNVTIQAVEWAPIVNENEREEFIQIANSFHDNYKITEKTDDGELIATSLKESYIPVLYVNPVERNETAIGFDLSSDAQRYEAIKKAISSKSVVITERINLVQIDEKSAYGFLALDPVFDSLQNPIGISLGVFNYRNIVERLLSRFKNVDISIELYDITDSGEPVSLYVSQNKKDQFSADVKSQDIIYENEFVVGGRNWLCMIKPLKMQRSIFMLTWIFRILGLLLSISITGYFYLILKTQNQLNYSSQNLQAAIKKEKELNLLKTRFVSMASHEFRTPLSTILSSASLVESYCEKQNKNGVLKHGARIKSAVRNLTRILTDFLTLSRLEEGVLEIRYENFNLPEFLDELIDDVQNIAKKGQQIKLMDQSGLEQIHMDKHHLKNILINLLSNATKYSGENTEIILSVSLSGKNIIFSVQDHGIGISEADQEKLFTRFFRADNVLTEPGTGLGLNIVQKYVEAMNGKVGAESQLGKGTLFWMELPLLTDPEGSVA